MAVFRRPELEKDNPIAPQMYVGPRRRRALTRAASTPQVTSQESVAEVTQRLTAAAERFVASVSPAKKSTQERKALLKAITLAHKRLAEVSRDGL
jgi:flagellum-specific peptidoglycan hydrolase FlgJ